MITKEGIINAREIMLSLGGKAGEDTLQQDIYKFRTCVCRHLDVWHMDGICIACASQFLFLCEEFRAIAYEIEVSIC